MSELEKTMPDISKMTDRELLELCLKTSLKTQIYMMSFIEMNLHLDLHKQQGSVEIDRMKSALTLSFHSYLKNFERISGNDLEIPLLLETLIGARDILRRKPSAENSASEASDK